MKKRLLAVPLWFYAGWTAGAFADFVANTLGYSIGPVLAPILGTAAAALFVGDPRRLIWTHRGAVGRTHTGARQIA